MTKLIKQITVSQNSKPACVLSDMDKLKLTYPWWRKNLKAAVNSEDFDTSIAVTVDIEYYEKDAKTGVFVRNEDCRESFALDANLPDYYRAIKDALAENDYIMNGNAARFSKRDLTDPFETTIAELEAGKFFAIGDKQYIALGYVTKKKYHMTQELESKAIKGFTAGYAVKEIELTEEELPEIVQGLVPYLKLPEGSLYAFEARPGDIVEFSHDDADITALVIQHKPKQNKIEVFEQATNMVWKLGVTTIVRKETDELQ